MLIVASAMLAWVAAYALNHWAFGWTVWGIGIDWIFLPAAARLGAVLLFGWRGALGIGLGTLLTSMTVFTDAPVLLIGTAIVSALSPWIAVRLTFRHFDLKPSLAGLTARHLVVCTVLYAAINAIAHGILFWWGGHLHSPMQGMAAMFTGDLFGAVLVLYVIKLLIPVLARSGPA